MDLSFDCQDTQLAVESERRSDREWGAAAPVVRQRLFELAAFETLATADFLPTLRFQRMPGNHAARYSVSATPRYRLILEPAHDPVPMTPDGEVDLARVTAIRIVAIEESHGH